MKYLKVINFGDIISEQIPILCCKKVNVSNTCGQVVHDEVSTILSEVLSRTQAL